MKSAHLQIEIGISESEITESKNRDYSHCIFMVAGRMIYRKGHDFLLDTISKIPADFKFEVRIIGNGPELKRLKNRCQSKGILSERVQFVGSVPYEKMIEEYHKATVFIMPSIRETTGTVILEALGHGLPVITINRFGAATILNNENAWLYDGQTKEEFINGLKDAMIDCIRNPEQARRKGKNAQITARKLLWSEKGKTYQKIYDDLLGR